MKNKKLALELIKTRDGIIGTLAWIEPRVKPEVFEKVQVIAEQSVRFGILKNVLEGKAFNEGLDKEVKQ